MPSRLRIIIQTARNNRYTGRNALGLVKSLVAARNWPKVNWEAIAIEGRRKNLWSQLWVWQERRGLTNRASAYRANMGRRAAHSPAVQRERVANYPRRPTFSLRNPARVRNIGDVIAAESRIVTPRPATRRPGIFA